ncbi:MAG TPA: MSMEG_4193 family putative phosphomutase [Aggregatilinea sp.]|jgi:probable phosphoglycerate mutase|uniref:MSMEG_4193 family putative phosphomutase n=1 Tax=Aggregatilinea sp. TaxID=2806333 RepID=UPI002D10B041|nr:MSMEG_4193 family putative phosphomutase [Aggregatilinea sp.]HML20077.1 MSMEG_4193 family putative phosphomutase [Aggregatilinea sp.]
MTEFLLIRHATNTFVSTGRLAGWTPGVHLNDDGKLQAAALGERLASVKLAAIYASPLERTVQTAEAVAAHHEGMQVEPLEGVGEVRYGTWQGAKLSNLRREKLWDNVQTYPSRVQFPSGETIRQAQARAVDALEQLFQKYPSGRVVVVSHSDIIKLIVAHYLGAHIDFFQRIEISPASLTILALGQSRPYIVCVNDTSHLPRREPPGEQDKRRKRFLGLFGGG